jgi:hypothetical protein
MEVTTDGRKQLIEANKIFKITYSINILPGLGEYQKDGVSYNEDTNLMGLLNASEELDIFGTKSVLELIQFKWEEYAMRHHMVGMILHFFYLAVFVIYVNIIYIKNTGTDAQKRSYVILLAIGCVYPQVYNIVRISK